MLVPAFASLVVAIGISLYHLFEKREKEKKFLMGEDGYYLVKLFISIIAIATIGFLLAFVFLTHANTHPIAKPIIYWIWATLCYITFAWKLKKLMKLA